MRMEVYGKRFNDTVFEEVQANWDYIGDETNPKYRCKVHDVTFDNETETCWECWDKCWEDI